MDINTFITKIDADKGLAPLDKFQVIVTPPPDVKGLEGMANNLKGLEFLCDAAPMPGKTIATSELRHYGPTRKIAREVTYPEMQLSFIMTNAMTARNVFLDWMNFIISPITANIEYQDSYKGDIEILMLSQQSEAANKGNAILAVKYEQAYPTNVDPINLGWDQMNQLGKFSVNFAYKKWSDTKKPYKKP